jgi:hypothetical protein
MQIIYGVIWVSHRVSTQVLVPIKPDKYCVFILLKYKIVNMVIIGPQSHHRPINGLKRF